MVSENILLINLKGYLDTVHKQVMYMNKIISDLLDYARPIQFEPVETNIRQLIRSTILTMDVPETIDVSIAVPEGLRVLVDSPLIR